MIEYGVFRMAETVRYPELVPAAFMPANGSFRKTGP